MHQTGGLHFGPAGFHRSPGPHPQEHAPDISYGMKSPPPALALICVLLLWAALICFGETDSRLTQCSLLRGPAELWRNIQPDHQSGFQDFNLHRGDRSVRLGSVTEISAL